MSLLCQRKVYAHSSFLDVKSLQLSNENDPALHSIQLPVSWYNVSGLCVLIADLRALDRCIE